MAPDPYRRTNGSPSNGSRGWTPPDTSYQRLQVDNLLRRELKISDPADAKQIAEALLSRYRDTPRARTIEQEARGLPTLQIPTVMALPSAAQTSSASELKQATDDVERDLQELTTNTLLKDVTPELRGWAQAVRAAIREGTNAAGFGLDSRQRDKAMAIRRQLGDYGRMARLVGALTPNMSQTYRKFAQSLDEVAAVILVMLGESLANVGFSGGQYLLQVPYTELQVRRDAVIYALRNLVGSTQEAYGQSEWPRGLDAYRRLYERLEQQGQGDLRALLTEQELARVMDELIQRAANGNPEGLRALGATAELDLERFRRLVAIGQDAAVPESPPLATFLEAVQLFADAFARSGGFRLLRIARPPILSYGLYGMAGLTDAESRLLQLVIHRNHLADLLDCYLECGCSTERVRCQILLDKILYDTDRAIDLYAFGIDDFGEPERRASAYAFVIDAFVGEQGEAVIRLDDPELLCVLTDLLGWAEAVHDALPIDSIQNRNRLAEVIGRLNRLLDPGGSTRVLARRDVGDLYGVVATARRFLARNSVLATCVPPSVSSFLARPVSGCTGGSESGTDDGLVRVLTDVRAQVRPVRQTSDPAIRELLHLVADFAAAAVAAIEGSGVASACTEPETGTDLCDALKVLIVRADNLSEPLPLEADVTLEELSRFFNLLVRAQRRLTQLEIRLPMPAMVEDFFSVVTQELCLLQRGETRWRRLVESLAPSCLRSGRTLDAVGLLLAHAIELTGGLCDDRELTIPPDSDTSLDNLVNATTVTGRGRWP